MPKILKYNYVNFDDATVNIEAPEFDFSVSFDDFENNIDNAEFINKNEDLAEEEATELNAEEIINIAKMQAEEIVENAKIEMEKKAEEHYNNVCEKAEEDAKLIYSEAEKKGYDDGYKRAVEETEVLKQQANELLEEAKKQKEEILEEIEPQVVELAVSVINKVLNDVTVVNPQIVVALIKKGLSETKMTGDIFVHVSATEYDAVMQNKEQILELNDPNVTIEIVKDYSLESGGCVLETAFGNIDCSIDAQFKKVKESLYFILENR